MTTWLKTLQTGTDFALARKLPRMALKLTRPFNTQPSDDVRQMLRPIGKLDADALIASSHVLALHFQTIAAANGAWRA